MDNPNCENSYNLVRQCIYVLKDKCCQDSIVAKLTFGFWTYQFSSKVFFAGGSNLPAIFPDRPFGTNQKKIFQDLIRINDLRNRIAHYEPICFDSKTASISTAYAVRRYTLMLDLLQWMGADPKKLLFGIDGVQRVINIINKI